MNNVPGDSGERRYRYGDNKEGMCSMGKRGVLCADEAKGEDTQHRSKASLAVWGGDMVNNEKPRKETR